MSSIEDMLQLVNEDKARAHERARSGAPDARIDDLCARSQVALGVKPPEQYLEFLRLSDGLDYNGLVVYDCASSPSAKSPKDFWQGLVAANQAWRDNTFWNRFLILGDSDMDVFAFDLENARYSRVDRVARETVEHYESFNAMLEAALQERL